MDHIQLIRLLDHKPNHERRDIIVDRLNALKIDFTRHEYATGENLIVDLGKLEKMIGVSSHFDRFKDAGGANDNGSAIAVCLDIIEKFKATPSITGIRVFFFDEEETGLKGSSAYVKKYGVQDLMGLINMELVGMGDKFALWPVRSQTRGRLLEAFEAVSSRNQIVCKRFDQIVTNTSDHLSFQNAGLLDSFTITCISDRDTEIAQHYYQALEKGVDKETLAGILLQAPLFENYHWPNDTFDKLSEKTIHMTASAIWETILEITPAK